MATITKDEDNAYKLHWKCWQHTYDMYFLLPQYLSTRNIIKVSLPEVFLSSDKEISFQFAVKEEIVYKEVKHPCIILGYDLGGGPNVYSACVITESGKKIAEFDARKRYQQSINSK